MTHYSLTLPQDKPRVIHRERWETFAAFLTFAALVALVGATYGALRRGDVHTEVQKHESLRYFAGMLSSSDNLSRELGDKSRNFTVIAPSDMAFRMQNITFLAEQKDSDVKDKRIVRIDGGDSSYILQGEGYVVRSYILPHEVPSNQVLQLPAANGDIITMSRIISAGQAVVMVNGVPVRDRVLADNGIIYIVDAFIHSLPSEAKDNDKIAKKH